MGLTYAEIELINSDDLGQVYRGMLPNEQVRRLKVSALVDSGAMMLSISQSLRDQLGIRSLGEADVELADGSVTSLEIAGPLEVRFQNRRTIVEALVVTAETEVLLGVIPMEAMDVMIDPKQQKLVLNPKSPGRARLMMK